VTPGVVVDGKLVTNDLVEINLGLRILLGHSFYRDWEDQEMFAHTDPLGNKVDRRHPWNQHTIPAPQKRDFDDKYSWTMSPRWFDGKDHLALDTGGTPPARLCGAAHPWGPRRPALGPRGWLGSSTSGSSRPPARPCRSTCRRRSSSPRRATS